MPGTLEQSNVSMVERIAELTDVASSYETLLRAVTVLMNDVDRGAITGTRTEVVRTFSVRPLKEH